MMNKTCKIIAVSVGAVISSTFAFAHDIWIEPSTNLIRTGDWIRLSLMLGNHGNGHRDFKLASKVAAGRQNLAVIDPAGKALDLTSSLTDSGYTPQEGYWTTTYQPSAEGLYLAASTLDQVMTYAPVRDIKSAKTFFLVSNSLDKVVANTRGFDRVLGHPFEIVPMMHPVTKFGPGSKVTLKVLFKGKPAAGIKVSFLPKGGELRGDLDPAFERITNSNGTVEIELKEANTYLVVAHSTDKAAKGPGYESIGYSASLTILVPGICPCCSGS